jgi:hypothetical protein
MTKYSNKIKNYLDNIKPTININPISNNNLINNDIIRNISECTISAINTKGKIVKKESKELKAIHTKDEYPLLYIFFKLLHELDLLDIIEDHTSGIKACYTSKDGDIHKFMDWHRKYVTQINIDKIHELMDKLHLDRNNTIKHNADTYTELQLVYRLIYKTTGTRKILHDALYNNGFVTIDVQYDLETTNLDYVQYAINDKHTVHMFIPRNKSHPDIQTITTIITLIENLSYCYKIINTPIVNLTVIFSNQKKNVYPWTKVLCCDNINSGSTVPGTTIICWRREEFYKVLIHELIHYYKFDFFSTDRFYSQLVDMLKIPQIEGIDMLNECYTEACTIIILIIFRYYTTYTFDTFTVFFLKELKYELRFIMFQIAKIITIFGGTSWDDFASGKIVIKQMTSFRSYFIIKLLLLFNLDVFLTMMSESMLVSNERLLELGDVINDSWTKFINDEYNIKIINRFIIDIHIAFQNKNSEWIYHTCRMSVNDTPSTILYYDPIDNPMNYPI